MIQEFRLSSHDFGFVGSGLKRPECVLALDDGTLWTSDQRATVTIIAPTGEQALFGPKVGTPNGLALDRDGTLYVADIDAECVYRVFPDGRHETLDHPLPGAINFVHLDDWQRLWITVCTRTKPRRLAVETPIPDGYIALVEGEGMRIVADGLCFPNEVRLDAAGQHLFVAETATGRVLRGKIGPNGDLGPLHTYGPANLFDGSRIDGICFDAAGNLWVTEITRNGLFVIAPDGTSTSVFEDPSGATLDFPTSIAFGGPNRSTAYVGSLHGDRLAFFAAPFPGQTLRHWKRREGHDDYRPPNGAAGE